MTRRVSIALAALWLMWPGATASAQSDADAETHTSDDGLATLTVPAGAASGGSEFGIVFMSPEEMPVDLTDWPNPAPHYVVQPVGDEFDQPVRVTRRIPITQIGIDPAAFDRIPIAALAIRDAEGEWSWLSDPAFVWDAADQSMIMSGSTDHGGEVFTFSSAAAWFLMSEESGYPEPEGPSVAEVGGRHMSVIQLQIAPDSIDTLQEVSGLTGDASVAMPQEALVTEWNDLPSVQHFFECVGDGDSTFEAPFLVDEFGGENWLTDELGLPGVLLDARASGTLTCED